MPVQQGVQTDGQAELWYQCPPESLVVPNTARTQRIEKGKDPDYREGRESTVRRVDELPVR